MKKLFYGLIATLSLSSPVIADQDLVRGWNTNSSMGCMMLRECTEGVVKIKNVQDVKKYYNDVYLNYDAVADELNSILALLDSIGVEVFLADEKYFPPFNRGVYHTHGNKFFLNASYMKTPGTLMAVVRHEGWHVAQDCMAAGVDNNFIAVIYDDHQIPQFYRDMAERTYPEPARPWEQEALWAGHQSDVTLQALQACAAPAPMWDVYEPTPMTREWLIREGHLEE